MIIVTTICFQIHKHFILFPDFIYIFLVTVAINSILTNSTNQTVVMETLCIFLEVENQFLNII